MRDKEKTPEVNLGFLGRERLVRVKSRCQRLWGAMEEIWVLTELSKV